MVAPKICFVGSGGLAAAAAAEVSVEPLGKLGLVDDGGVIVAVAGI